MMQSCSLVLLFFSLSGVLAFHHATMNPHMLFKSRHSPMSVIGLRSLQSSSLSSMRMSKTYRVEESDSGEPISRIVDVGLISKWTGATVLQFGLICATLFSFDFAISMLNSVTILGIAPKIFASLFFAFMAIRSRIFSTLDNSRPTPPRKDSDWNEVEVGKEKEKFMEEVKRPSWMPPPRAFPVIWSVIGLLRCISSVLVWEAMGRRFFTPPLLALMAHLCVGDTWNTINNVEKRKGTAAAVVTLVLASAYNAIWMFYQVSPKAGFTLAPSGLWLTVATVLVWTIWIMNGSEPMLPFKKT